MSGATERQLRSDTTGFSTAWTPVSTRDGIWVRAGRAQPLLPSAPRAHHDFRLLAGALPRLDGGGVVVNVGSAVLMPEVFLKALTLARNLHAGKPGRFTACNLDMQLHYRPRVNILERPTRGSVGRGFHITGHHEIMVPLLAWAVVERLG